MWTVVAIAVVAVAAGVAILLGTVMLARHRASSAADEAALAVASHALAGPAGACAVGDRIARLDGATMRSCTLVDAIATVDVEVVLPAALRHLGAATGQARAGPISAAPGNG